MATEKRLIDADWFIGAVEYIQKHLVAGDSEFLQGYIAGLRGAVNAINEIPKADAVEVVRCKDCKHYDNSEGICWCHLNSKFYPGGADWHSFPEDGFCSYGERRTDG